MSLEDAIGSHATGYYVVTRTPEGTHQDGELVPADVAADLEVSAVDTALDTLTSAAHGLATGDGPFRLLDGRGQLDVDELPDLPDPLTIDDEYWVIAIDADTIQLAASSDDALALVFIDLTTAGLMPMTMSVSGFMLQASVQPMDGRTLSADEDSDRTSDDKLCLVVEELFTRKPGREPDSIEVDGESYTVVDSEKWDHWGGRHYECTISRDAVA